MLVLISIDYNLLAIDIVKFKHEFCPVVVIKSGNPKNPEVLLNTVC